MLNKQQVLHKKLLAANARIDELNRGRWGAKPIPLKKKIFTGHWRHLAVRADVLRSSIGQDVAAVVAACDHWVLGKKKEEKSYNCTTEVLFGKKPARIPGQYLQPISQKEAEKAGFSPAFLRKWFDRHTETIGAGTKTFERHHYYPKVRPHMIEFAFKPAFIVATTHPNPDAESELARLYKFMDAHDGWTKLQGRHRDEWDLSLDKKRTLEKLRAKEQREALGFED